MAELDPAVLPDFQARIRRATRISAGRYAIEAPSETEPDRLVADLRARGARFLSANPLRSTLEDFFVQQVAARRAQPPAGRLMPEG
jgi:hypothetical protein